MGATVPYHILVGDDYDDSHHLADLRVPNFEMNPNEGNLGI